LTTFSGTGGILQIDNASGFTGGLSGLAIEGAQVFVAQRDALQRSERIAGRQRAGGGGDEGVHAHGGQSCSAKTRVQYTSGPCQWIR